MIIKIPREEIRKFSSTVKNKVIRKSSNNKAPANIFKFQRGTRKKLFSF